MAERPAVPRYLIDNSVWARLATEPTVKDALTALTASHWAASILVCPPVVAEYGFSARNAGELDILRSELSAFDECNEAPGSDLPNRIQHALWSRGLKRSVGAMDTLIASYAIVNDATVVHYDSDFDHIGSVVGNFRHQWIVLRGTLQGTSRR